MHSVKFAVSCGAYNFIVASELRGHLLIFDVTDVFIYLCMFPLFSVLCYSRRLLRRVDVVDAGDVSDASNRHLDIFYTGEYTHVCALIWAGCAISR